VPHLAAAFKFRTMDGRGLPQGCANLQARPVLSAGLQARVAEGLRSRDRPRLNAHLPRPARASYSSPSADGQRPRKTNAKSIDPGGVAYIRAEVHAGHDITPIRPFQGRACRVAPFRGRCPRLLYRSPLGISRMSMDTSPGKERGTRLGLTWRDCAWHARPEGPGLEQPAPTCRRLARCDRSVPLRLLGS